MFNAFLDLELVLNSLQLCSENVCSQQPNTNQEVEQTHLDTSVLNNDGTCYDSQERQK